MKLETEQTPEGTQTLVPGVKQIEPIAKFLADRKARYDAKKSKAQEPGGMFDDAARDQVDLLDLLS